MKILVFSDSHGRVSAMLELIHLHHPDYVFHLGDLSRDVEYLYLEWPDLKVVHVPGNCDGWTREPLERLVELEGKRFLLCHGHTYHVKAGLSGLRVAARQQRVDAALFGHTHQQHCEYENGLWLMNPGSAGGIAGAGYGVILLEHGEMICYTEQWIK